jgi:hypothetical protein
MTVKNMQKNRNMMTMTVKIDFSTGCDTIQCRILKFCKNQITTPLVTLINNKFIIKIWHISKQFKNWKITSIYKFRDKTGFVT